MDADETRASSGDGHEGLFEAGAETADRAGEEKGCAAAAERNRRAWAEWELGYLLNRAAAGGSNEDIAAGLQRTPEAVRRELQRLASGSLVLAECPAHLAGALDAYRRRLRAAKQRQARSDAAGATSEAVGQLVEQYRQMNRRLVDLAGQVGELMQAVAVLLAAEAHPGRPGVGAAFGALSARMQLAVYSAATEMTPRASNVAARPQAATCDGDLSRRSPDVIGTKPEAA